MVEAFDTGDHEVAREAFREFDRQLLAHLAMEEQTLLLEFAEISPIGAAQIVDEHRDIRSLVDELGIGTDLHITRAAAIRELADLLRAHARREDALLYRWAEEHGVSPHPDQPAPEPQPSRP